MLFYILSFSKVGRDYETEFVKDTSDDNLCVVDEDSFPGGSILTIRETFDVNVEYEIETSDSDRDRNCFTTDSDSDFNEVIESAIFPLLCQTYSDAEYLADNSSDENTNSFDFEIPEEDKWLCRTCSTQNDPLLRRCASCWKLRCGWVSTKQANVERNPRKRKARNRKKRKKATNPKNKVRANEEGIGRLQSSFAYIVRHFIAVKFDVRWDPLKMDIMVQRYMFQFV
ncbi:UNVERIFIED_CONTAM: hypothetical protein NCL1_21437 [Trichonephila clavipes]